MTRLLLPLALFAATTPVLAQDAAPVELSLEHRMLLRCSAAFAMVAYGQDNGNEAALRYPHDEEAYREFFVRASGQVMDETGMDEDAISAALSREAQDLWDSGTLEQVMPPCLDMLRRD